MAKFKKRWLLIPLMLLIAFYLWGMWAFMTGYTHRDYVSLKVKFFLEDNDKKLMISTASLSADKMIFMGAIQDEDKDVIFWEMEKDSVVKEINCLFTNSPSNSCVSIYNNIFTIHDLSWFQPKTIYALFLRVQGKEDDGSVGGYVGSSYTFFCRNNGQVFFSEDDDKLPSECKTTDQLVN
ncbi:hypothetical protein [Neisseria dumasiana]|uniref:Lipoprotein n=1 Tax=Neisseria dumasiana TaxID=1931275 RepID=A0ABX3WKG5_9NEIS|nr:hypothetical protein [Neisseria dumasiana]OSI34341.1 hypothetical protein BV913_07285 [Neisseria dumasiana]UOO84844.1 hypothetical protein LVJ88_02190 [Neisseria dumasiana]